MKDLWLPARGRDTKGMGSLRMGKLLRSTPTGEMQVWLQAKWQRL